jgi:hypothetical protein
MKILTPLPDLMLKINNQVGENHKERSPLRGIGSHLCGSNQKIKEILEGMAEAILYEDWLRFDDLNFSHPEDVLTPSDVVR